MKKLFSILLAICLIAGLLPVVASAASATITFGHESGPTSANVAEGDVVYFVTEDGKVHNNGNVANAGNYQVKVDYTGSEPTIYLKGATLINTDTNKSNAIYVKGVAGGPSAYTIVVESDSSIQTTGCGGIVASNAHLTITGEGKLSMDIKGGMGIATNDDSAASGTKFDLTFDFANVEMTIDGEGAGMPIGVGNHAKNVIFNGGTFVGVAENASVLHLYSGDYLITNNAELDLSSSAKNCISRQNPSNFRMESGHLKIRTSAGATGFGFSETSTISFSGGTVDFSGDAFIFGPVPDFSEYLDEHTIVVCQSKDGKGAEPYDAENHKLGYMNYFQLTKGSSYEVTVKNGTTDLSVASKGDTVTITARIAPDGKVFDKWEVNTGAVTLVDPTATSTTFTMPGENVKITATYKSVETEEEPTPEASTPEASTPEESTPEVSTPEASTPDESTPDNTEHTDEGNNEGNKNTGKKKANVTNVLLIVIIVILVLGIGAGAAFIVIRVKKLNAGEETADDAEAPAEEATEDAETPAEDAE